MPISNHPSPPRLVPARGLVAIGLGLGAAEAAAIAVGGAAMPAAIALPALVAAAVTGYALGRGHARPPSAPAHVPGQSEAPTRYLPGSMSLGRAAAPEAEVTA